MKRVTVTGIGGGAGMSIVKSLRRLNDCYIVGLDADEYAAGKTLVDEFHIIPEAVDKDFVDKLAFYSRGSEGLFPTVDEELPIVAQANGHFGQQVFVSSKEAVENTRDKLRCIDLLSQSDIPVARTMSSSRGFDIISKELGVPFVMKPRTGRGSKNKFEVDSQDTFRFANDHSGTEMIAQKRMADPEYSVDVLADSDSNLVCCVPRERVRVRDGLSVVGRTLSEVPFVEIISKTVKALKLSYIVNIQMMSQELKIIEVNARAAGSLILSTEAGINMPGMLLNNDLKSKRKGEEDVWMYRREEESYVRGKMI